MYSKEEAFQIKTKFWTAFGQYMLLHKSAIGTKVNWVNYKTGVKDLYFRIDADNRSVSISIEMTQRDLEQQQLIYEKFEMFKDILHNYLTEEWVWQNNIYNDQEKSVSIIKITKEGLSIFRERDWNEIISFFKSRLVALDQFWQENGGVFKMN